MYVADSFPIADIVRLISHEATPLSHQRLTGGVSADVVLLEFESEVGQKERAVFRALGDSAWKGLSLDSSRMQFELQEALFKGGLPVPRPLRLDTSCEIWPVPYVLMEFIAGSKEIDANDLTPALSVMAQALHQIHSFDTKEAGGCLPAQEWDDPVRGALSYVPDTQVYRELRSALRAWHVDAVDEVLLHGDYWPGNLLWLDGRLNAILDWEDAAIGSPESDIAGCRCELMILFGQGAADRFTACYTELAGRALRDLPVWDVYASFAALATMAQWGLPAEVEAHRRRRTEQFAERAVGAVLAAQ